MAITLQNAAAKAALDAIVDLVDVGAGTNGTIAGYTSGNSEVFTCTFGTTAFGPASTASPSVAVANTISDDTSATGGDLTGGYHRVNDQDGNEVWRGSIGTSGADLNISVLDIPAGAVLSITVYQVNMPTS